MSGQFANRSMGSILRTSKFARQPKESVAQFAQGQALPLFGKTGPLKSGDQVVGQANDFQVEGVGRQKHAWESCAAHGPPGSPECVAPLRPIVGMVLKFRDLPTGVHRCITQTSELALQGGGHCARPRHIGPDVLPAGPTPSRSRSRIGPHPQLPNVGRGGVRTASQQLLAACPGASVAASQFHIPQERGVRFHTEPGS